MALWLWRYVDVISARVPGALTQIRLPAASNFWQRGLPLVLSLLVPVQQLEAAFKPYTKLDCIAAFGNGRGHACIVDFLIHLSRPGRRT